ncbi:MULTISPECIES: MFS transporter [Pseudofrankia]|uniref:MFS transporter n=1 Tax=Pseudofrankia TaxID=2994363 RepID=UPI0004801BA8|nr:Puromycin resistance protein pur8 [Pseudofrankia sp. EUN1h]
MTLDTTPADTAPADRGHPPNPHHARRWLILGVLGIAQLMVVLDATIVNIALPSAQSALHFSDSSRQWVITAYALAFGSLLLLGGRIGDLFGRKRIFLIGLVGFAAASALGGAASSFEVLVVARALQGLFGALVAPAGLSLLATTFTDPDERGKAFGIYSAIAGAGGAIGLLLGGVLTEYLSWRWSLYVNVGFAAAAAVGALILLHHERSADRPHLDIPGAVTVSGALFALVYGLSHADTDGWRDTTTLAFLAAGAAGLAVFTMLQARVAHPLLPLRVLRDRDRGGSLLAMLTVSVGMFAVFLFLTYYLRNTLGYSAIRTGFAFLPLVGATAVGATLATSTLEPRLGSRRLVAAGFIIAAGGMAWLAQLTLHATYATQILPPLIVVGAGSGLIFASTIAGATLGVGAEDSGVASAAVNTAQQVGGSIGTALLSTIAASAASDYLTSHPASGTAAAHATLSGYTTAFWWTATIFAAAAVVIGALLRPGTRPAEEGAPVLVL